jgi:5-methyltetrahydrofolate--homocysteine methyltransferase
MSLNFSPQDWERIKRDWTAWWHHDLDRPMVVAYGAGKSVLPFIPQFEGWDIKQGTYPVDEVLDQHQLNIETIKYYGDAWPTWWPNFGAGVVAAFLGSGVGVDENTVWFEPVTNSDGDLLSIQDILPQYTPNNFWWRWVKTLTQAAIDRWGGQVEISHTDLGGNLDIIASLRGTQNLLTDLYDAPEEVDRLVNTITQLWMHYYDEQYEILKTANNGTTSWAPLWCHERFYMLQSDFAYMISPQMFGRFVLPDLEATCNHLDYGFYHLDGKNQIPHVNMLLSIKRLRGIQWIPGDGASPADQWLPLLKRIRNADKLCQVYVSPEGALTIARELGGKGFAFMVGDFPSQVGFEGFIAELEKL